MTSLSSWWINIPIQICTSLKRIIPYRFILCWDMISLWKPCEKSCWRRIVKITENLKKKSYMTQMTWNIERKLWLYTLNSEFDTLFPSVYIGIWISSISVMVDIEILSLVDLFASWDIFGLQMNDFFVLCFIPKPRTKYPHNVNRRYL